jgi:hypothetical protein
LPPAAALVVLALVVLAVVALALVRGRGYWSWWTRM